MTALRHAAWLSTCTTTRPHASSHCFAGANGCRCLQPLAKSAAAAGGRGQAADLARSDALRAGRGGANTGMSVALRLPSSTSRRSQLHAVVKVLMPAAVNLNASAHRDANAAGVPGCVQLAAVAARTAVCSCLAPVPIDRHTLQMSTEQHGGRMPVLVSGRMWKHTEQHRSCLPAPVQQGAGKDAPSHRAALSQAVCGIPHVALLVATARVHVAASNRVGSYALQARPGIKGTTGELVGTLGSAYLTAWTCWPSMHSRVRSTRDQPVLTARVCAHSKAATHNQDPAWCRRAPGPATPDGSAGLCLLHLTASHVPRDAAKVPFWQ